MAKNQTLELSILIGGHVDNSLTQAVKSANTQLGSMANGASKLAANIAKVTVGGNFLAMKGASGEEELAAARGAIKKLGGVYKETRTLHLPGGDTRTLILCQKISQTPTAYPRNGGKIAKSPLK